MGTTDPRGDGAAETEMERHDPGTSLGTKRDRSQGSQAQDERPQDVRDAGDERADGRPTGHTDEDGLRAGASASEVPTEPAEDRGHRPTTDHAPGGDL